MTADTRSPNGVSKDPAAIEADIARQREELARTVDALGAKLDVKAQARHRAAHLKDSATTDSGQPRPELVLGATALLAGVVALVWWRRHR